MSRINLEDSEIRRPRIFGMTVQDSASFTITGALTLTDDMPGAISISAAAPQNVLMPPTAGNEGLMVRIINSGAATLTLQTSAGGALSPAVTVATATNAVMQVIGGAWKKVS